MSDSTVNEKVICDWLCKQFSALLEVEVTEINPELPLDELSIISLDVVHVLAGAMRHFKIKVPRAEFEGQDTIGQLARLFSKHNI